jgi:outer membrane protein OmpA-like peptidoglycan-associated protein
VPDRDKDGIGDEEDNCPDVFGVVRYRGCPVPDKDKDGVSDEDDKCPDLAGTADNLGCPAISIAFNQTAQNTAKAISFSGSKLSASSNKGLDELARLLVSNKPLFLDVEATSSVQAEAIKSYLVKKGVSDKRIRTISNGKSGINLVLSYF